MKEKKRGVCRYEDLTYFELKVFNLSYSEENFVI